FGLGAGLRRGQLLSAALGGGLGALLGTGVYEMIGGLAFPFARTDRAFSLTWETRLIARLGVALGTAAGAALGTAARSPSRTASRPGAPPARARVRPRLKRCAMEKALPRRSSVSLPAGPRGSVRFLVFAATAHGAGLLAVASPG